MRRRLESCCAAILALVFTPLVPPGGAAAVRGAEEPAWVAPMREVRAKFRGKPGTFAQFGDSITVSLAFWTPLAHGVPKNIDDPTRADYDLVKEYLAPPCWREWKGPKFGSQSGQTALWARENIDAWLKELQPEAALLMFGTNDLANVSAEDYESRMREAATRCLERGTVVILSTIPPRHGREEKAAEFAEVVRRLGRELKVPVCDFHAEVLARRPEDWNGALPRFSDRRGYDVLTLIAGDGVHPSNPKEFSNDFSEEALRTNGFSLRNYLALRSYAEVVRRVLRPDRADSLPGGNGDDDPAPQSGREGARTGLLLDTDLGGSFEDPLAIGLLLAAPEVELLGLTTSGTNAADRAWIACRLLSHAGHGPTPVAAGAAPQPELALDWQIQYRRHPAVIFNRTQRPAEGTAQELLHARAAEARNPVTILALGPLTNLARLLESDKSIRDKIARIVACERHLAADAEAARAVLHSGVPLVLAPERAAAELRLEADELRRILARGTRLTHQLKALRQLCEGEEETLTEAAAAAVVCGAPFLRFRAARVEYDPRGRLREVPGTANAELLEPVDRDEFAAWLVDRLVTHGEVSLPEPPGNRSEPVGQGGLPVRVHAFEDFETEIERRWWMSGKLETEDAPRKRGRAMRGVLTQDFDDRQGQTKTSYTAVVFNPVPGPPMGPRTRLSFRYKLLGSDQLRVQLYSLSNGYHRYLSLHGLRQGEWRAATVDMTHMRRPDGSGGPLAADERIDDIQFYTDPRAELLIDDIVLYEAAPEGERRPFPNRILFTGWFDTGKQGNEWPGDFVIEPHAAPRSWKFARSVPRGEGEGGWIRLGLRGPRPLGEQTRLRFHYRLTGGDRFRVELHNTAGGAHAAAEVEAAERGRWSETEFDFPAAPAAMTHADELRFLLPEGAELAIDDLLLYVP